MKYWLVYHTGDDPSPETLVEVVKAPTLAQAELIAFKACPRVCVDDIWIVSCTKEKAMRAIPPNGDGFYDDEIGEKS